MTTIPTIDAPSLKRRLDEGSAVLIDIREPGEHAQEHVAGSRLVPLSTLATAEIRPEPGKAVVFCCLSGMRTARNAATLLAKNLPEALVLAGGLQAWKAAGLPLETGGRQSR